MPARARRWIPRRVRFEVLKRDGFRCRYCGAAAPGAVLVIDHVRPLHEGGTDDPGNLITSCESCNSGKGAKPLVPPDDDQDGDLSSLVLALRESVV